MQKYKECAGGHSWTQLQVGSRCLKDVLNHAFLAPRGCCIQLCDFPSTEPPTQGTEVFCGLLQVFSTRNRNCAFAYAPVDGHLQCQSKWCMFAQQGSAINCNTHVVHCMFGIGAEMD
eukprot:GHRR01033319.1.p1 GENE.GHRR01033319.1~~GHRR01033319.1.p1  ORF type:complete len:127 (-),score=6.97 GHRR01033319.1:848-1198(-)